jgi:diaminohydroxyphosphoribosylaminopyrimidine deaminase / 5-amino-6-(5-phosphoribosylamino)uracil reductase
MTHPGPMVGALVVENGQIVAEGHYGRDGGPHAERVALSALGRRPRPRAVLYVTLEPCSTEGRTGACTQAILAAGIKHVVAGATDPNPEHGGKGFEILRSAGVNVVTGVLADECRDLNVIYNHWIPAKQPFFAGKLALTLDGRSATRTGESQWITGEQARLDAHRWRRLFPAIGVGAATVLKDNPLLTSRLPGEEVHCPIRFIFDGMLRTAADRTLGNVYTDEFRERTIVVATSFGGLGYARKLREQGVQVWIFGSKNQRVPWPEFRSKCRLNGISGILVEGGPHLLSEMTRERELDYFFVYHGASFFGDSRARGALAGLKTDKLAQSLRLSEVRHSALGDDMLTRGKLNYPQKLDIEEDALMNLPQ